MRRHTGNAISTAALLGLMHLTPGAAGAQVPLGDPALDQALRQAGWEVRRSADGLVLHPPRAPQGLGTAVAPSVQTGPAAEGPTPDWDRLRGLGWRVERGADGSTLLYPPPPPPPSPSPSPKAAGAPSAVGADKALDTLLQERGWRVERDPQGALLLYPRGRSPGAPATPDASVPPAAPAAATGSASPSLALAPGVVTAPVRDAEVQLPVDRWAEARAIADAWLAEQGVSGWRVGKIRQVHRVYMVSIVDGARPPNVVHQIAIVAGNGLVVVLN